MPVFSGLRRVEMLLDNQGFQWAFAYKGKGLREPRPQDNGWVAKDDEGEGWEERNVRMPGIIGELGFLVEHESQKSYQN